MNYFCTNIYIYNGTCFGFFFLLIPIKVTVVQYKFHTSLPTNFVHLLYLITIIYLTPFSYLLFQLKVYMYILNSLAMDQLSNLYSLSFSGYTIQYKVSLFISLIGYIVFIYITYLYFDPTIQKNAIYKLSNLIIQFFILKTFSLIILLFFQLP